MEAEIEACGCVWWSVDHDKPKVKSPSQKKSRHEIKKDFAL